eukprot:452710_1
MIYCQVRFQLTRISKRASLSISFRHIAFDSKSNFLLEHAAIKHIQNNLRSLYGSRIIEGSAADYAICDKTHMKTCLPIQIKCRKRIHGNSSGRYLWNHLSGYHNMLMLFYGFDRNDIHIWYAWSQQFADKNSMTAYAWKFHPGRIHNLDLKLTELYYKYPEYHVPLASLNKRRGEDKNKKLRVGRIGEQWVFDWCKSAGSDVNRHPDISGSKYDLIVNQERIQVKSTCKILRNGAYNVNVMHVVQGRLVPYSDIDFDVLAICIGDENMIKLKHLYWIPIETLKEQNIVSTKCNKGKLRILMYPCINKGKYISLEKFRCDF